MALNPSAVRIADPLGWIDALARPESLLALGLFAGCVLLAWLMTWCRPLTRPVYGCIVVMKRGKNPGAGHVGFYVASLGDNHIRVLGGNQSDAVTIATFRRSSVLSYRWPVGHDLPGQNE